MSHTLEKCDIIWQVFYSSYKKLICKDLKMWIHYTNKQAVTSYNYFARLQLFPPSIYIYIYI